MEFHYFWSTKNVIYLSTLISNIVKNQHISVINYTDLRLNLKKWLDLVVNDVEELVIKRKNNKDLALVPLDEYNALKETSYLFRGKNREVLMSSIEESKSGKSEIHNLIEE